MHTVCNNISSVTLWINPLFQETLLLYNSITFKLWWWQFYCSTCLGWVADGLSFWLNYNVNKYMYIDTWETDELVHCLPFSEYLSLLLKCHTHKEKENEVSWHTLVMVAQWDKDIVTYCFIAQSVLLLNKDSM